jgi:hypothetical protein
MTNIFWPKIKFFSRILKNISHQTFGHCIWWPSAIDFLGIAWKFQAMTEFFWAITIFFPFVGSMTTINWMIKNFECQLYWLKVENQKSVIIMGLIESFQLPKKMVNIHMHPSICMCSDGHWCDNTHNVFASCQFWQPWPIVCLPIAYMHIPTYIHTYLSWPMFIIMCLHNMSFKIIS